MKKIVLSALIALAALTAIIPACGKSDDEPAKPCTETEMGLQVSTSPAANSVEAPAVGPDFPLTVNINGGMPSAGVTIEVSVSKESGGGAFFTKTQDSKAATNAFTITGTTTGTTNIVKVTVTSKSCAGNKWTGSYRYSMK